MATNEALVLDSLAINDSTTFMLLSVSMPPPAKKPDWVSGADSDGAILGRDPTHENRVIEARIAVMPQASKDLALAKIGLLVDKFEECERNAYGLALTWVPANATLDPVTFRCLSGEITDMPIDMASGWLVETPELTVKLTCLPFWEKAEVSVGSVTSSAPIITYEITGVGGDVPALGRLVVTDAASKDRRYVEWGLESRWYPTSSPPSLIVDSASMVTSGFAGATATRTAAYSGASNNVIGVTARRQLQAVCGLGNLAHVGEFRPQLRFYASATTIALRLSYRALDGPLRSLSFKVPVAVGFNHVDLGAVTLPQTQIGTQRWTGQIEVYSTGPGGETFQVDALWLMPAELFGRARGVYTYTPGVQAGYDDFASIAATTALNGRTSPFGGSWATSGVATDFTARDAPDAADETEGRSTASEATRRFAILGSTNYTDTEAGVDVYATLSHASTEQAVIARWVDSSNYLRLSLAGNVLALNAIVAGAVVAQGAVTLGAGASGVWRRLRVVAFPSGTAFGALLDVNGATIATVRLSHSSLATAGALATGKPGFSDMNAFVVGFARYYDNFYAAVPPAEAIVCYSGQSIEFRHNAALREDSTGTYAGPPPEYVGARFTIPCAGGPSRKARVAVIARRLDVESANDDDLTSNATTDSTIVQIYKTERGLAVPR